jgi:hypothetical protein
MNDSRITENQWQAFSERFSHQHQGWRSRIYQFDRADLDSGARVLPDTARTVSDEQPLQEVRADGNRGEVILTVGQDRAEISYLIEDAVALFNRGDDATDHELRIDSRDGSCTLVSLRAPD